MINLTFPESSLAQGRRNPHSRITCSQSRGRGLVTSNSERRSRFLGRVVVAHVQGSPKGGDALGSLMVTSTRLCPVPPILMGACLKQGPAFYPAQRRLFGPCPLRNAKGATA